MADATLQTYQQAIQDALQNRLSNTVNFYDYDTAPDDLSTPAVLISCDTFSEDAEYQPGEDITLQTEWSVYVVLGRHENDSAMQCRLFALKVLTILRKGGFLNFDNVSRPEGFFALAAAWKDDVAKYNSWVVSWEARIDVSAITDPGDIEDLLRVYCDNEPDADAPQLNTRVDF